MKAFIAALVGVLICVGFAMVNAILYADHPHGRGLNLFAMVWSGLMGAWTLYNCVRLWELRRV